tara:strand:+ start:195 stop:458 length:264 start_codon:yes stop_codon:yes gene_type:complete
MAKSLRQELAEAREKMAFLEEENSNLRKGASSKPELVEVVCKLAKQTKKSRGGKFVYAYSDEERGIKVYVYSSKPMASNSEVYGKVK